MKGFIPFASVLGLAALCLTAISGYVLNVIKLAGADTFAVEEAIRAVGILAAPIGIIMGLFV